MRRWEQGSGTFALAPRPVANTEGELSAMAANWVGAGFCSTFDKSFTNSGIQAMMNKGPVSIAADDNRGGPRKERRQNAFKPLKRNDPAKPTDFASQSFQAFRTSLAKRLVSPREAN